MSYNQVIKNERVQQDVLKVCITGAAGQIAYSLYNLIGNGQVFGNQQEIELRLLDIEPCVKILEGVKLELEDCAYTLVKEIKIGFKGEELFKDADVVIFLGGYPRKPGMERKDLLQINNSIFKAQGQILNDVAKPTCKSLVIANPANTNCYTLASQCSNIPKKNFTCLTRLDQNRGFAQISNKTHIPIEQIRNIIIWGNHSATQYPDVHFAQAGGKPVYELLEKEYLQTSFISRIQKRGAEIIEQRGGSSVMSAANAVKDHLKSWIFGAGEGEYISMGVFVENGIASEYDVTDDTVFSLPVTCKNFEFTVVPKLELSEFSKQKIAITLKELQEEKADSVKQ